MQVVSKSSIGDIKIISTWPGDPYGSWKTPTRIAYSRENPKIGTNKWGFEVYPKLTSYSWTKLLLDKNAAAGEHDDPSLSGVVGPGMFQLPSFRDAPGVCEDFLHEVYLFVSKMLRQQLTDSTFEKTPMECWITLPAIWSDEAKAATLTAARNAGFGCKPIDEVFTIAEPEAAAIATLKKYAEPNSLNPIKENENILICDCGGGTVDITTYTITQVRPYLTFDELCVGVGGKCGSTHIDRNLHALLSKRFGLAFDNVPFGIKGPGGKLMTCFEGLKRDFGVIDNGDDRELGPINLDVPESEFYDPVDRLVKLSYEDMQSLFDPAIAEITTLVGQQVEEARKIRNATINRIILIGGFGASSYLNKALALWCGKNGGITLICPLHPQAAVVQGAALRGLEGISPRVKYARRHYGFEIASDFREGIDSEIDAFFSRFDENRKLCRNRILWLISKGDEITKETSITASVCQSYSPGSTFVDRTQLYSCALTEAPDYSTDSRVNHVGSIESTFGADFYFGSSTQCRYNNKSKEIVYQFSYNVQVRFGDKGDNLTFKAIVNGQEAGSAIIKFDR
ncbi:Hsp70 family protein-like protein [Hyaloscypha sp. PMI_1271]|nr:Hsp70 family protein-like protein [Hyaloscypha sp. PMI_1271]